MTILKNKSGFTPLEMRCHPITSPTASYGSVRRLTVARLFGRQASGNLPARRFALAGGFLTGFTLLEVLVALSVLSLCLVLVLQTISSSLRAEELSNALTRATFLAQGKLEEVFLNKYSEVQDDSGDFGEDNPGFSWEITVTPIIWSQSDIINTDEDEIKKIELTVSWPVRNKLQKLELITFVGQQT